MCELVQISSWHTEPEQMETVAPHQAQDAGADRSSLVNADGTTGEGRWHAVDEDALASILSYRSLSYHKDTENSMH